MFDQLKKVRNVRPPGSADGGEEASDADFHAARGDRGGTGLAGQCDRQSAADGRSEFGADFHPGKLLQSPGERTVSDVNSKNFRNKKNILSLRTNAQAATCHEPTSLSLDELPFERWIGLQWNGHKYCFNINTNTTGLVLSGLRRPGLD